MDAQPEAVDGAAANVQRPQHSQVRKYWLATPIDHDGRASSPIVVKIGPIDTIIDEFQRYETHVRAALPLLTARLEEAPTIPKSAALGGLKYTLVAGHESRPRDLRQVVQEEGFERVQQILQHDLCERFGRTWWKQRKPYRFQAWQEYDWLLPPILVLEPNILESG